MVAVLALLFLALPVLEVWVINVVQGQLGSWPLTILILVLDSLVGAILVRQEGMRAWRRFTTALAAGQAPTNEIVEGALILVGGALLLTPGFITDVVGLACVITPTRRLIAALLRNRVAVAAMGSGGTILGGGSTRTGSTSGRRRRRSRASESGPSDRPGPRPSRSRRREAEIIDVEVVEIRRSTPEPDDGDDVDPGGAPA